MKPAHPLKSKMTTWGLWAAVVVVIILLGSAVRSLVRLCSAPQSAGVVGQESVRKEMQNPASKNEGQGAQYPMPEPAQLSQKAPAFTVDFRELGERETERKETAKTLQGIARDNPESGYAMTAEQRHKFEQSGASFR